MGSNNKNILDDIFGAEEEDVGTFAETILGQEVSGDSGALGSHASDFNSKQPTPIESFTPKLSRNGYIEMSHGYYDGAYVWHIKPWHPKKQYRVTIKRVLYAITKTMNEVIPSHVQVDVFMPNHKWEIPEISFKANKLMDQWSIKDKDIKDLNEKIFEVLNELV